MDIEKAEGDLRYVPDWLIRKAVKLPDVTVKVLGFAEHKILFALFGEKDAELTPAKEFVLRVANVEVLRTTDGEAARAAYNKTEPVSPWIS